MPSWQTVATILGIVVTITVLAKTPVGTFVGWVYGRLFGEPFRQAGEKFVDRTVTPQIDAVKGLVAALDAKNDEQHAQNARAIGELIETSHQRHTQNTEAIELLRRSQNHLQESIIENRMEVNDKLGTIQRTLDSHFGEAAVRDQRITNLEGLARIRIEVEPTTGELPVIEAPKEEQ